ncbi:hypothetical protein [Hymenobacter terrenus]|uniref:hypothetical protein n=1 Tax=Hymenobacter terrenus TaxID=1629124 RepID=UPI000619B365|nr:hypothetical protein [Hymenobacter terrenus]
MEKIHTLLWILFGIGVFVFRMVKKMQETSARESRERPPRPGGAVPSLPTATFQEMLRQMQARNTAEPNNVPAPTNTPATPQAPPKRTPGGHPMPREVARPARSQERTDVRQTSLEAPATARPHNAPAPPARRSSSLPRASVEAPMPSRLPATTAGAPASVSETVRQLLRQPESVRAAFVLSEIFQRKY